MLVPLAGFYPGYASARFRSPDGLNDVWVAASSPVIANRMAWHPTGSDRCKGIGTPLHPEKNHCPIQADTSLQAVRPQPALACRHTLDAAVLEPG